MNKTILIAMIQEEIFKYSIIRERISPHQYEKIDWIITKKFGNIIDDIQPDPYNINVIDVMFTKPIKLTTQTKNLLQNYLKMNVSELDKKTLAFSL